MEAARQTKVSTHLLAFRPDRFGPAQAIADRIKEGVIGPLRALHSWGTRPVWPQYTEIPTERPPVPKGFDWDLWLGPSLPRPYHPHYTHNEFRGWYEFGGGSIADTGIYGLWPVFTALDLGSADQRQSMDQPHVRLSSITSPTPTRQRFRVSDCLQDSVANMRHSGTWPATGSVLVRGRHAAGNAEGAGSGDGRPAFGRHDVCRR